MLARLAARRSSAARKLVIAAWVVLTLFGVFSAPCASPIAGSSRFSIPGYSAYETNQKVLENFGNGEQAPLVAVFRSNGDVTKQRPAAGHRRRPPRSIRARG